MAIYRVYRHTARPGGELRYLNRKGAVLAIVTLVVIVAVPLAITSERVTETNSDELNARAVATKWGKPFGWSVVSITTGSHGVVVREEGPLPIPDTAGLRSAFDAGGLRGTSVQMQLTPSEVVDLATK
jgi:hypothetical protein